MVQHRMIVRLRTEFEEINNYERKEIVELAEVVALNFWETQQLYVIMRSAQKLLC